MRVLLLLGRPGRLCSGRGRGDGGGFSGFGGGDGLITHEHSRMELRFEAAQLRRLLGTQRLGLGLACEPLCLEPEGARLVRVRVRVRVGVGVRVKG